MTHPYRSPAYVIRRQVHLGPLSFAAFVTGIVMFVWGVGARWPEGEAEGRRAKACAVGHRSAADGCPCGAVPTFSDAGVSWRAAP